MKRSFLITWIAAVVVSGVVAGPAGANSTLVAGWDFSQYFATGALTINGTTFTDRLDANYSNMDPTFGAGAESAAFGTMYIDGTNGSTNVVEGSGTEEFTPNSRSLTSNLIGGAPTGLAFDAFPALASEGQKYTSLLRMTAPAAVSVVFEADLTSTPVGGKDWTIVFGGRTFSGTATVGVEFSENGSTWVPADDSAGSSRLLTATDTRFKVRLKSFPFFTKAYARLNIPAPGANGVNQVIIDNVSMRAAVAVCKDGIDNDLDGLTDFPADTGCRNLNDESEGVDCNDGIDNDGDGGVDWAGGPSGEPPDTGPGGCNGNPNRIRENNPPGVCGLGFELALLLPAVWWVRWWRRLG